MHVDFDPVNVEWDLLLGDGGGVPGADLLHGGGACWGGAGIMMGGGGAQGYTAFSGMPFQRGAGVGGVFRQLMRFLLPIGRAVGREGLETGARVLSGYLGGKDLKETMVHESKAGVKNLLEKAAHNLEAEKQSGKGFDFKHYKKEATAAKQKQRRIKRPLHSVMAPPTLPNQPLKKRNRTIGGKKKKKGTKRLRLDSLGFY